MLSQISPQNFTSRNVHKNFLISTLFPNTNRIPTFHRSLADINTSVVAATLLTQGRLNALCLSRADEQYANSSPTGFPFYISGHSCIRDHCQQTGHSSHEYFNVLMRLPSIRQSSRSRRLYLSTATDLLLTTTFFTNLAVITKIYSH